MCPARTFFNLLAHTHLHTLTHTHTHTYTHTHTCKLVPLDEQCDPTGAAGGPIEPWVYVTPSLTVCKQRRGCEKHHSGCAHPSFAFSGASGAVAMSTLVTCAVLIILMLHLA